MLRGIIEKKTTGEVIVYRPDRIIYPDGTEVKEFNDLELALSEFKKDGTKYSLMYK